MRWRRSRSGAKTLVPGAFWKLVLFVAHIRTGCFSLHSTTGSPEGSGCLLYPSVPQRSPAFMASQCYFFTRFRETDVYSPRFSSIFPKASVSFSASMKPPSTSLTILALKGPCRLAEAFLSLVPSAR